MLLSLPRSSLAAQCDRGRICIRHLELINVNSEHNNRLWDYGSTRNCRGDEARDLLLSPDSKDSRREPSLIDIYTQLSREARIRFTLGDWSSTSEYIRRRGHQKFSHSLLCYMYPPHGPHQLMVGDGLTHSPISQERLPSPSRLRGAGGNSSL